MPLAAEAVDIDGAIANERMQSKPRFPSCSIISPNHVAVLEWANGSIRTSDTV
jgi:hypothetical protein